MNRDELAREMLAAMASEGVTLSDDLGQCELAILAWVRSKGAAMLEAHLGKKTRLPGSLPIMRVLGCSEVRKSPPTDDRDHAGHRDVSTGVLPLSAMSTRRVTIRCQRGHGT